MADGVLTQPTPEAGRRISIDLADAILAPERDAQAVQAAKVAAEKSKPKPTARPAQKSAGQAAAPELPDGLEFQPGWLTDILAELNKRFRERKSLWATTDREVKFIGQASERVVEKHFPNASEWSPEKVLIAALALYAAPRALQIGSTWLKEFQRRRAELARRPVVQASADRSNLAHDRAPVLDRSGIGAGQAQDERLAGL